MPARGPVPGWTPPPPPRPRPSDDLWRQYLGLLRQLKAAEQRKRRQRLETNARGLAARLWRNFDEDSKAYPAVEPIKYRDPC